MKKGNVMVDTLIAGSVGLPEIPKPVFDSDDLCKLLAVLCFLVG
jgi:hypothetical protein